MISEAIDEYIALHHTKLIRPLLNQVSSNGKKKYNQQTATKEIKNKLTKMYLN